MTSEAHDEEDDDRLADSRHEDYEHVEVKVELLKRQTSKAGLFVVDGREVWLPWSQIAEESEVAKDGDSGVIYIPRWLAEKNDLEYDE